mmetsp:Transcript_6278/g.10771  ORF Transcript_6278/g.10771 Transcript_6278/m.10771 type:complete len:595 (-) Transcript_6278:641-2425(-)
MSSGSGDSRTREQECVKLIRDTLPDGTLTRKSSTGVFGNLRFLAKVCLVSILVLFSTFVLAEHAKIARNFCVMCSDTALRAKLVEASKINTELKEQTAPVTNKVVSKSIEGVRESDKTTTESKGQTAPVTNKVVSKSIEGVRESGKTNTQSKERTAPETNKVVGKSIEGVRESGTWCIFKAHMSTCAIVDIQARKGFVEMFVTIPDGGRVGDLLLEASVLGKSPSDERVIVKQKDALWKTESGSNQTRYSTKFRVTTSLNYSIQLDAQLMRKPCDVGELRKSLYKQLSNKQSKKQSMWRDCRNIDECAEKIQCPADERGYFVVNNPPFVRYVNITGMDVVEKRQCSGFPGEEEGEWQLSKNTTDSWTWVPHDCTLQDYASNRPAVVKCLANKTLVFFGDSMTRTTQESLMDLLYGKKQKHKKIHTSGTWTIGRTTLRLVFNQGLIKMSEGKFRNLLKGLNQMNSNETILLFQPSKWEAFLPSGYNHDHLLRMFKYVEIFDSYVNGPKRKFLTMIEPYPRQQMSMNTDLRWQSELDKTRQGREVTATLDPWKFEYTWKTVASPDGTHFKKSRLGDMLQRTKLNYYLNYVCSKTTP